MPKSRIINSLINIISVFMIFLTVILFSNVKSFAIFDSYNTTNKLVKSSYSEDIEVEEEDLDSEIKKPAKEVAKPNQNIPNSTNQNTTSQKTQEAIKTQNNKKDDIKLEEGDDNSELDYFDNLLEQEKRKNQMQSDSATDQGIKSRSGRGSNKVNDNDTNQNQQSNINNNVNPNTQIMSNPANNKVKLSLIVSANTHGAYSDFVYIDEINKDYTLASISSFVKDYKKNHAGSEFMLIDLGSFSNKLLNNALISRNNKKEATENPMAKAFNFLGYDVLSLKEEDIKDYESNALLSLFLKDFNNKIVASNLYDYNGALIFKPISILTKGNLKIAYLNFLAGNNKNSNKEGIYYTKSFLDSYDNIVLSHLSKDRFDLTIFAVEVNNIDEVKVIEKFLSNKKYNIDIVLISGNLTESINEKVGKTYFISHDLANGLLNIELVLEKTGDSSYTLSNKNTDITINKIVLDGKYPQDGTIVSLSKDFDSFLSTYNSKKLFTLGNQEFLPMNLINKVPEYLVKPSVIGSLIGDTLLDASKAKVAIIPLLPSYNLSFYDNTIREVDIKEFTKSLNTKQLKVYQFKGRDLKSFLEWAVTFYSLNNERGIINIETSGSVKGILYLVQGDIKYAINLKNQPGNKITRLTDKTGKVIEDNDIVTIATLDAGSQDVIENTLFKNRNIPVIKDFTVDPSNIFLKYILSVPNANSNYPISTSWYITNLTEPDNKGQKK